MNGTVALGRSNKYITPMVENLLNGLGWKSFRFERNDEISSPEMELAVFSTAPSFEKDDAGKSTGSEKPWRDEVAHFRQLYPTVPVALSIMGLTQEHVDWIKTFLVSKFPGQKVEVLIIDEAALDSSALGNPYTFVVIKMSDINTDRKNKARKIDLAGKILAKHAEKARQKPSGP